MSNIQEKAKNILKKNTEKEAVHFTSDGNAFFDLNAAEGHASRMKDKTVTTITRDGGAKEKKADDPATQTPVPDDVKGQVATNPVEDAEGAGKKKSSKPKSK